MAASVGAGFAAPTVSVPKGGGAIRGLGETFANNPVTGTSGLTIPLPFSPGRSGFTPAAALTYDSGAGNGPCGVGWTISLPAITRRTDRGLPRYRDDTQSDVFLLSSTEDLVPVLRPDGSVHEDVRGTSRVRRYRPRVEGLFARIERWTNQQDPADVHWRSITRENLTTLYGTSAASRIADPRNPARIFSWLVAESFDDRGNASIYDYVAEDGRDVDLTRPSEASRTDLDRSANRYLKRVRYGNRTSRLLTLAAGSMQWLFELVVDYGDHDGQPTPEPSRPWPVRPDPFSTYRAGFEVRTYRRCRRFLMFHHFDELAPSSRLVRALELDFADLDAPSADVQEALAHQGSTRLGSFLRRATSIGFGENGIARTLPPLELAYTRPSIEAVARSLDTRSIAALGGGVDGVSSQWLDLDGEGLAGVLCDEPGGWWYKRNLGEGRFDAARPVSAQPRFDRRPQFLDLGGDGELDAVVLDAPQAGFYERTSTGEWSPFVALASQPNIEDDADVRLVDLTGDGHADLVIVRGGELSWHPSLGEAGFGDRIRIPMPPDDEQGPQPNLRDPHALVTFADMSGDGLPDLVRVRNGEVSYWPNLGYGRFGARVVMDGSPVFDTPDHFDPARLRLADIDGSGVTDLIYLGRDDVRLYFNQAGNGFAAAHRLRALPPIDNIATVTVTDLLGIGTACLVWSTPLSGQSTAPIRYVDLMGGVKPHLLARVENNLGARTEIAYAPSTKFYLADRAAGRPWTTKLPFPVHVVERTEIFDEISRNRFVRRFQYHDGFFDGQEREFRGFGEVEQLDTEELSALGAAANIDATSHVPPILTRTRFHTGAARGEAVLTAGLDADEEREAIRALKGAMLRSEVFALDGTERASNPYSVTEQQFEVRRLQPRGRNRHAVFMTHQRESVTRHTERRPDDPRVVQSATLEIDEFGNVLRSVSVAYGRLQPDSTLAPGDQAEQSQHHVTIADVAVTNPIDAPDDHRAPVPYETRSFELTGLPPPAVRYTVDELRAAWRDAVEIAYETKPTAGGLEKRVIEHTRALFRNADLSGSLPLGQLGPMAIPFETYQLAFTPGLVAQVFGNRVSDAMLATDGRYVHSEGDTRWWIPSGRILFATAGSAGHELTEARTHFFAPRRYVDPFGHTTEVTYDGYDLLVRETRDPVSNTTVARNDYRVLAPSVVTDPNGNRNAVAFDALGFVVATAVMGKEGESLGDTIATIDADLSDAAIADTLADPLVSSHAVLRRATTRLVYDVFAYQRTKAGPQPEPPAVLTIARETHDSELGPGEQTRLQLAVAYSDGFGRSIQRKAIAPRAPARAARWIASAWTVFDNKGQPVRTFEPFFTSSPRYEPGVQAGVASTTFYDPLGRVIGVLHPDHTWTKTVFDAWRQETWDVNDTVLLDPRADPLLGPYVARFPERDYLPTWHERRSAGTADEQASAVKAAAHAATPVIAHLDSLARVFVGIANTGTESVVTRTVFDIEGNVRAVVDPLGRVCMRYEYDLLGHRCHQASMEAGERWMLADVAGKPTSSWDSRGHQLDVRYDEAQRPLETRLGTVVVSRTIYGESSATRELDNLRGRPFQQSDQAGVITNERYDFKGNLVASSRQLVRDYRGLRDWSSSPALESEPLARATRFDALNRPIATTAPDGSLIVPSYDEAGMLDRVDVNLRGSATATAFITGMEYNARGQRLSTAHGNGVRCTYAYDAETFRLVEATTVRTGGAVLQDLRYTFDAAGNLTHIADDAQQTIYFANQVVPAATDYEYDAIYRLLGAEGREHLGQATRPEPTFDDAFRTRLAHPQDGQAMRRYSETYRYDAAGNLLEIRHAAQNSSWRRTYRYGEASQLEPNRQSNRLSSTAVGAADEPYAYDAHGNLIAIPHLSSLTWNFLDQLEATSRQVVTSGTAETTFYVYDASGQRLRKVTERQNGTRRQERIYLGELEVFREYDASGDSVVLARETLHVSAGQRVALVETRTLGTDPGPAQLVRYQHTNHLGSATLELDGDAQVISYEEYYPYGSTSYQAVRSQTETPKRYRYTGMERDEESGLAYHGARYYAPWLGRWTSCDPAGVAGGMDLYEYCNGAPTRARDRTGESPEDCTSDPRDAGVCVMPAAGVDTPPEFKSREELEATKRFGLAILIAPVYLYAPVAIYEGALDLKEAFTGDPSNHHVLDLIAGPGPEGDKLNPVERFFKAVSAGLNLVPPVARTAKYVAREWRAISAAEDIAAGLKNYVSTGQFVRGASRGATRLAGPGAASIYSEEFAENRKYVPNKKHGAVQRVEGDVTISRAPKDGQAALDFSFEFGNKRRRIGIDEKNREVVVLPRDAHRVEGKKVTGGIYHGFVPETWAKVPKEARDLLRDLGLVDKRGQIVFDPAKWER